jgi:WD40 repeat protein
MSLGGFLWHNAEVRAEAVQDLQEARREMQTAKHTAVAQEKLADKKRAEVKDLEAIAERERQRAKEAQQLAQRTLYAADMLMARAAWENDNVLGLLGLLRRHRSDGDGQARGFEWNYLWRLAHQERYTLRASGPEAEKGDKRAWYGTSPTLVAVSPDGKTLATASGPERLKLWDLETGKERRTLAKPAGLVTTLTFAPGGKEVWAVSIQVPEAKSTGLQEQQALQAVMTGKTPPSLQPLEKLLRVDTVPVNGGAVTSGPLDPARMKVPFNVYAGGAQAQPLILSGMIPLPGQRLVSTMCVAASPDGKLLAVGGIVTFAPTPMKPKMEQLGAILLWDVIAGREKALLLDHNGPINALAFAPDGQTLASAGFDKTIKLWDVAAGRERAMLRGHTAAVFAMAFSGDGKRLASGAIDGIVKVWDLASGQQDMACKGHVQPVISMAWTPDGRTLVSGSMDGLVKVWDLALHGPRTIKGFEGATHALAFTSDGGAVAGVDQKGNLIVSDSATGDIRTRLRLNLEFGLNTSAAFSPDARTVACGGPIPDVHLYDVATGARRMKLPGHAGVVYCLSFAPGGKTLAVGTGQSQKSGVIKLWEPATGKELRALTGYKNHVVSLAWSADAKVLAGGAKDGMVKLWAAATGQELLSFQAGTMRGGAPPLGLLEQSGGVKAIAFSPDGRLLAVASGTTITLRDARTGNVVVTVNGYAHEPDCLVFSPDGRRLASGGGEGELGRGGGTKLWDMATGMEVLTLGGPSEPVRCVTFSPDGGRLAASSGVSSAIIFSNQATGQVTLRDGRPVK